MQPHEQNSRQTCWGNVKRHYPVAMKAKIILTGTAALSLVFGLSACFGASPAPTPVSSPPTSESASPTPSPTPTPTPFAVNPDDYLIDGTPYVLDSDGFWGASWGFFTDDSRSVMCIITLLSGDPSNSWCWIMPGHESEVTYALPASADPSGCPDSNDGYMVGLQSQQDDPNQSAAFTLCHTSPPIPAPAFAKTKVLPPLGSLTITDKRNADDSYTCSAKDGAATCTMKTPAASFTFGLHVATLTEP